MDDLPYRLHTNRELGMILRGEKPLAIFTDAYGHFPGVVQRYLRLFGRHVVEGWLLKREYVVPQKERPNIFGWHTIMYAVPHEEWRFDAMIALRFLEEWTMDSEREEGACSVMRIDRMMRG